jgi:CheY-like chemotaxis protein
MRIEVLCVDGIWRTLTFAFAGIERAVGVESSDLPRALQQLEASYGTGRVRVAPRPAVLIVEDDDAIREALEEVIRAAGFDVAAAANGAEALDHLRRVRQPWFIVLDLMMPVMTGWDVLDVVQNENLVDLDDILVITAAAPAILPEGVRALAKPLAGHAVIDALRERCG